MFLLGGNINKTVAVANHLVKNKLIDEAWTPVSLSREMESFAWLELYFQATGKPYEYMTNKECRLRKVMEKWMFLAWSEVKLEYTMGFGDFKKSDTYQVFLTANENNNHNQVIVEAIEIIEGFLSKDLNSLKERERHNKLCDLLEEALYT